MKNRPGKQLCSRILIAFVFYSHGTKSVIANVDSSSTGQSFFLYQQSEYPKDCKEVTNSCSSTQNVSGVYVIKPDGYPEPFEVYCDNDVDNGGWTVLQRRMMGSITFNRGWSDFKHGFGFLGSEFWIGNDKIAFLTNQKQYQLRFDFTNAVGQDYFVTYDRFRISDEWGQYSLSALGLFRGTADSHLDWCPSNEVFSNETCESTCDEPDTCISPTSGTGEKCVCVGDYKIHDGNCILQDDCGCFVVEEGFVIREGDSYVNLDCTRRLNCSSNHLDIEDSYQCSDDATCDEKNGVRRCYCNDGFEGDGVTCTRSGPRDCYELQLSGTNSDGVYTIYPDAYPGGIQVKCEMQSNGGGWTVIQQRSSASVGFYRTWNEYKAGFEHPSRDHWLGNDYIHALTTQKNYSLRIDLTDSSGSSYYALYSSFSISDNADKYRLSIGSYTGSTGHDSMSWHNNRQFSTRDEDNDGWSDFDCAEQHRGAWWFGELNRNSDSDCHANRNYCEFFPLGTNRCAECGDSHLNADYDESTRGRNIFWEDLNDNYCSLRYVVMKIRPMQ